MDWGKVARVTAQRLRLPATMLSINKILLPVVAALALVHASAAHAALGFCFELTNPQWEQVLDANGLKRLLIVLKTAADRDQPATQILVAEAGRRGVEVAFTRNPGTLPRPTFAVQELTANQAQLLATVEISPGGTRRMATLEFRDRAGHIAATFSGLLVEGEKCAAAQAGSPPRNESDKAKVPPADPADMPASPMAHPEAGEITPEELLIFARLVDDGVDVVRARLASHPDLVPLVAKAVDARGIRLTAGTVLSIGSGLLLFVGLKMVVSWIGSGICAGASDGGDRCEHPDSTTGLALVILGAMGTIGGLARIALVSDAEEKAKARYFWSSPPPVRVPAVSSPRRLPGDAPRAFLIPLLASTF